MQVVGSCTSSKQLRAFSSVSSSVHELEIALRSNCTVQFEALMCFVHGKGTELLLADIPAFTSFSTSFTVIVTLFVPLFLDIFVDLVVVTFSRFVLSVSATRDVQAVKPRLFRLSGRVFPLQVTFRLSSRVFPLHVTFQAVKPSVSTTSDVSGCQAECFHYK